jgi:hypothetical protein
MNIDKQPKRISKAEQAISFLTDRLCVTNERVMVLIDQNKALLDEIEILKKANEDLLDRIDDIAEKAIIYKRIH